MRKHIESKDLLIKLEELRVMLSGDDNQEKIKSETGKENENAENEKINSLKKIENSITECMTEENKKKYKLSTATIKVSERVRDKLKFLTPLLRFEEDIEDTTLDNIIDILINSYFSNRLKESDRKEFVRGYTTYLEKRINQKYSQ